MKECISSILPRRRITILGLLPPRLRRGARFAPSLSMTCFPRLLAALACGASLLPAAPVEHPEYPLSAIVQADPTGPGGERIPLADALRVTRMGYTDDSRPLRAVLKAREGDTPPVIVYMGGFTTNHGDILWVERDHRLCVAMVDIAKLGGDLEPGTTEFKLTEPRDGELAVVASTADGIDLQDRTKYCYWIRIGDELMKVTAVDTASGRVTVVRGFDGTKAVAHPAGAHVFGPVYLGNRDRMTPRASSAWPGGTSRIRYAVNPKTPEAQAFKARQVAAAMREGYDGAWWDTFQPQPFNLCDALGRKIDFFWDFTAGKRYDFRTSLEALKAYTRAVRALVKQELGREPVLYGNSVSGTYARGSKELMNSATVHDLLDGYCFEDSYIDPIVGRAAPATRAGGDPVPPATRFEIVGGDLWLRNVTGQADAANRGLHALCMVGAAGYIGAHFNPAQPNYDELLRYSYASYLLTVNAGRSTSFGLTLLVEQKAKGEQGGATPWPKLIFARIGNPVQPNDIPALKVKDTPCYAREFERGFVAVYPQKKGAEVEIPIPSGLVDAETGAPVTSLRLQPGQGAVLLKSSR